MFSHLTLNYCTYDCDITLEVLVNALEIYINNLKQNTS